MRVPAARAGDDSALLEAACRAFEAMGAQVQISAEADNAIRSGPTGFVVSVQGLPNLVHELVHAQSVGVLDDDHGFPYAEIPLDLGRRAHRKLLWDELACCTLSCCALPGSSVVGRPSAAQREWFGEQVEILPVFYGLEGAPPRFRARVESAISAHREDFEAFMRAARARLEAAIGRPRGGFIPFEALWGPIGGSRAPLAAASKPRE